MYSCYICITWGAAACRGLGQVMGKYLCGRAMAGDGGLGGIGLVHGVLISAFA